MKILNACCLAVLLTLFSQNVLADTAMAKQVLAQNTTNPFCPAGNNSPGSDDQYEQYKKDQFEGACPQDMGYVECLRQSWQQSK